MMSFGDYVILAVISGFVLVLISRWVWVKYMDPESRVTVKQCAILQKNCRELLIKDISADQQQIVLLNQELSARLIKRSKDDNRFDLLVAKVDDINKAVSIVAATLFKICEKQTGVDCDEIFELLAKKGIM